MVDLVNNNCNINDWMATSIYGTHFVDQLLFRCRELPGSDGPNGWTVAASPRAKCRGMLSRRPKRRRGLGGQLSVGFWIWMIGQLDQYSIIVL